MGRAAIGTGLAKGESVDSPPKNERMLRPDVLAPTLADLSLDHLHRVGVRGIVLDLDNTLVGFGSDEPGEPVCMWVAAALARGMRVVLLSNNFPERVGAVASRLGVIGIPNALKPLPLGFFRALRTLRLPPRAVAVVGDQLFTDVLGGKLFGCYTVLTEPIEARDFPLTRILRALERLVLAHRRMP